MRGEKGAKHNSPGRSSTALNTSTRLLTTSNLLAKNLTTRLHNQGWTRGGVGDSSLLTDVRSSTLLLVLLLMWRIRGAAAAGGGVNTFRIQSLETMNTTATAAWNHTRASSVRPSRFSFQKGECVKKAENIGGAVGSAGLADVFGTDASAGMFVFCWSSSWARKLGVSSAWKGANNSEALNAD